MIELAHFQVVSAALFAVGVYGVLARKSVLIVLLSIVLMLHAVGLNLVGFAAFIEQSEPQRVLGQVMVLCVIAVSAALLVLATAVIVDRRGRSTAKVDGASDTLAA